MIFKQKFEIKLNDINKKEQIKNKALFECLENIAARHADSINHGIKDIPTIGTTWILLCWQLEVLKRPTYEDTIEIHTWARKANKCFTYRDFEVFVNGEKCAIAASKWMLVDIKRGRPTKVEDEIIAKYQPEYEKSVFGIDEIEKLKELESYDEQLQFPIRKSDIDINGHMHNLNYLDIVNEILTSEEEQEEFNCVRIDYRKEIKLEDKIQVLKKVENNKYYFLIKNINTDVTHAIIVME